MQFFWLNLPIASTGSKWNNLLGKGKERQFFWLNLSIASIDSKWNNLFWEGKGKKCHFSDWICQLHQQGVSGTIYWGKGRRNAIFLTEFASSIGSKWNNLLEKGKKCNFSDCICQFHQQYVSGTIYWRRERNAIFLTEFANFVNR